MAINQRCKSHFRYTVYHHEIAPYFCAIMIRKMPALRFIAQDIINFPNSKMGRYLMRVDVVFEGKAISLFTTHLESTQSSKQERINQLACCLTEVLMKLVMFANFLIKAQEGDLSQSLPMGAESAGLLPVLPSFNGTVEGKHIFRLINSLFHFIPQ